MATKDLIIRIRADFGADGAQLTKVLEQVQVELDEMTGDLKEMGSTASKAMDTIGLGAENQLSRLQRLSNGFQGLTGKLGQGLGAVNSLAKGMAPWNQALNLAGKAINFASDGLDEYAKKSPQAAKEVDNLKAKFADYRSTVMSAVGALTVSLLDDRVGIEKLRLEFLKLESTDTYKRFYKDGKVKSLKSLVEENLSPEQIKALTDRGYLKIRRAYQDDPLGALGSSFDAFKDSVRQGIDYWNTDGASFIDSYVEGMKKTADATKKSADASRKAAEEQAALAKELREQAAARAFLRTATTSEGRNLTDTAGGPIGWSTQGLGVSADSIMRDTFGRDAERGALDAAEAQRVAGLTADFQERLSDFQAERAGQRSFLDAAFGSVDEINAHDLALKGLQITFGGLETAVTSSMQAWISGSMSLGLAIKKGIGDALAGVASQMAIEGAKHTAFAVGSLAFGDIRGAGQHAAAAAAFGGGAVAAAVAARKLGASVNAEIAAQKSAAAGASGGGRDGQSTSGRSSNGASGGGQVIHNNYIVYGEHFYSESTRMRQLDAQRFVNAAVGQSFVEHS